MTEKLKILFLAANSGEETSQRTGREAREISLRLQASTMRSRIDFEYEPGVRARDLQHVLLRHQPHVLHFSGRGDKRKGILLADDGERPHPVDNKALTRMLKILKDELRILVFNACYTKRQAHALSRSFDYTIGMSDALDEESAINFAESFYEALGFGRTVIEAFQLGCVRLGFEGRPGKDIPFLLCREGLDVSAALLPPAVSAAAEMALVIPERAWDPERHPPAALLRADVRVVPFFGRTDELVAANAWLNQGAPLGVLLVTGRGGSGKTRFAVETCLRAKRREIDAGFFFFPQSRTESPRLFQTTGRPVLAVLDYAEEQHMGLPGLLQAMLTMARSGGATFRLLLLARNAGEWWTLLRSTRGEVGELLHSRATQRIRLGPVAADEQEAGVIYGEALDAFCAKLGLPARPDGGEHPAGLSREALLIHTQALLRALGEERCPGEEAEVFEFLLNRERGSWLRQLNARGVDAALLPVFEKIVAVITLRGGAGDSAYVDAIIAHFRTSYGLNAVTALNLRGVLQDAYGFDGRVEPLQPDLLGEHLLAQHLSREVEELASR